MTEDDYQSQLDALRSSFEREFQDVQQHLAQHIALKKRKQEENALFDLIWSTDLQALKNLKLTESQLKSYKSEWGDNLITLALRQHRWDIANFLLTQVPSFLHMQDRNGRTLLHLAVHCADLVKKLLAMGLSAEAEDNYGNTPLHYAALNFFNGSRERVLLLQEAGAQIGKENKEGQNALHLAIQNYQRDLVALWLPQMTQTEQARQAYLNMAFKAYNLEVFETLLQDEDFRPPYDDGHFLWNLLERPSLDYDPYAKYLHQLISQGFGVSARTASGDPLLYAALQKDCHIAALWLFKNGADPFEASIAGDLILNKAIQKQSLRFLRELLPRLQNIEQYISLTGVMLRLREQYQPELACLLLASGARTHHKETVDWLDNDWYLKKNLKMKLASGNHQLPLHFLLAFQENIKTLGFLLSPALAGRLCTLSEPHFFQVCANVVNTLRAIVGEYRAYQPMYPNFPHQVKELSPEELSANVFLHYWGDALGELSVTAYEKQPQDLLTSALPERIIDLGSASDFMSYFSQLQTARTALSPETQSFLAYFIYSRGVEIEPYLHADIPFRENAALVAAAALKYVPELKVGHYLKGATDILRTAAALSQGDVSLAKTTRFLRFPRRWRRLLLDQLNQSPDLEAACSRYPERFKRLGEVLHPGDYASRYPRVYAAFSVLRKGHKFLSYSHRVEAALKNRNLSVLLPLLQQRPDDFARRLDHVLRIANVSEQANVVTAFSVIAARLPSPLLMQIYGHFLCRTQGDWRVFFPKGEVSKLQAIPNTLAPLPEDVVRQVLGICEQQLILDYKQRPWLGKVYLDPGLKNYRVPFALPSARQSLRTLARGSRTKLPATKVLRLFMGWRDKKEHTSLTLRALAVNEDFSYRGIINPYYLREMGGFYSGDMTFAPKGTSAFIDIEVDTFLQHQARYVLLVVNSFTQQPYTELAECFAGFMSRQQLNSDEVYEPQQVLERFELTPQAKIVIPFIIDLKRGEMIWADLSLKKRPKTHNHVAGKQSSLSLLCQAMLNVQRPTLYDLLGWHTSARGKPVESPEQADIVMDAIFTSEAEIKPWHIERIVTKFL